MAVQNSSRTYSQAVLTRMQEQLMCSRSGDTVLGQIRHQESVLWLKMLQVVLFYKGKDLGNSLHCTLKSITNSDHIPIFIIQS